MLNLGLKPLMPNIYKKKELNWTGLRRHNRLCCAVCIDEAAHELIGEEREYTQELLTLRGIDDLAIPNRTCPPG